MSRVVLVLSLFALACSSGRDADDDAEPAGPSCTDRQLNGTEVDVDCGGSCGPCANGLKCTAPAGCASGTCTEGTCRKADACTAEGDEAFCERLQKTCGSVANVDNCGDARTVDCGACPREVTCTGQSASGVSTGATLGSLSEVQFAQLCDWSACAFGGYGKSVQCDANTSVNGPDDLAECKDDLSGCGSLTVGDYEACQRKIAAEPCKALVTMFTAPECAAARACLQ